MTRCHNVPRDTYPKMRVNIGDFRWGYHIRWGWSSRSTGPELAQFAPVMVVIRARDNL